MRLASRGFVALGLLAGTVQAWGSAANIDASPSATVFNGQDVPPIVTLEGPTYDTTIETGYWLVEGYSPYCHHCKNLAPKWQTLYEYYYTSDPLPASSDAVETSKSLNLNTFSRYYNLNFAKLDCTAFGSACSAIKIGSFPTIILFKNGEEIKRSEGDRDIKTLSKFIEECLELIRPGSRPAEGLPLPKVGAREFYPPGTAAKPGQPAGASNRGPSQVKLQSPSKPRAIPNPSGISVNLTAATFKEHVTRSLDPWFIKFYAPWCSHCQKMAASWSTMAREMQNQLNVGEVNCDLQKKLCKEHGVNSYPTIIYFRGPERMEYEGMRGLGDLVSFAHGAVESEQGVREVTAADFDVITEKEEVVFIYFHDHATTSEDMMALERLPMSLIGRAKIVKSNDEELGKRFGIFTYPRLIVWRDGKTAGFDFLMPQDLRNVDRVRRWMQSVWHPLVPELTAQNARDIMDNKFVVLGILDRSSSEFEISRKEIKNAATEWMDRQDAQFVLERQELRDAKQLRIEEAEDRKDERGLRNAKLIRINMADVERKEVAFAWIDGVFWERWVRTTFGISVRTDEGEDGGGKVVINDHEHRRYWDRTSTGNPIVPSRTSILETLTQIYATPPRLQSKPTGSKVARFVHKTRRLFSNHPILMALVGIGCAVLALFVVRTKARGNGLVFGRGGAISLGMGRSMGIRRRSDGSTGFLRKESEKENGSLFGGGGGGGGSKAD